MLHVNQLIGFGAGGKSNQVQFVGGKIAAKAGATSGNSTMTINSGLTGGISSSAASGDLVVAAFATVSDQGTDLTLSITDGSVDYTIIGSELYQTDRRDINLRVTRKVIGADTSVTFGPTQSTSYGGTTAVYVFRNVDQSTPIGNVATATGTDSAYANPPSITPTVEAGHIVSVGAAVVEGLLTFSSSDLTDFLQATALSTFYDTALGIGHIDTWTGGPFDAAAFGLSGGDNADWCWAAMSFAINSA
jgi:hypothetical protein